LGVNIMQVVNRINELTKEFSGMRVPVTVTVDIDTKEFEVSVGVPTTTALIIRELKVEKGSGLPHEKKIGNLSIEQIVKIALIKRKQLLAKNLKGAVKEVLGTCLSMGVTVEGKDPRVVQKEIDAGKYDEILLKYEEGEG
ncbi:MAG: 50S ribosomal protein L11, partial [Candidatus Methanomethylicota archaeon]